MSQSVFIRNLVAKIKSLINLTIQDKRKALIILGDHKIAGKSTQGGIVGTGPFFCFLVKRVETSSRSSGLNHVTLIVYCAPTIDCNPQIHDHEFLYVQAMATEVTVKGKEMKRVNNAICYSQSAWGLESFDCGSDCFRSLRISGQFLRSVRVQVLHMVRKQ